MMFAHVAVEWAAFCLARDTVCEVYSRKLYVLLQHGTSSVPVYMSMLAIRLAQATIVYSVEDNGMHFQPELQKKEEFETETLRDAAQTSYPTS